MSFNFGNFGINKPAATGFSLGSPVPATSTLGGSTNTLGGGSLTLGTLGSNSVGSLTTTASNPLGGTTSLTTNLLSNQATNTAASTNTTNASSSTSSITFKVLEDYINKWMSDLDTQEKDFLNQATQFNALDKLMIENGEKV
jgi:hypothetical protein